jgi:DHA2 family multidrug resistance protein
MTEQIAQEQQEWKPKGNPWFLIMPVMMATFMYALDETVANVALPHIAGSYSVSSQESIWVLTSYLMASSIVIPMIDFFCKFLGRKNFFMLGVFIFTIASFFCGISNSIGMIVIARAMQGFGGGCLIPMAQAITMETFKGEARNKAMAIFGIVVVVAPILGPVLGGWITENWSWPYIFFINVPFGFLCITLAKKFMEDPPYARKQKNIHLDKFGFLWLCVWLIPLQIVFDKGNDADWFNAPWICWLSAIALTGAVLFFYTQIKGKNPLVKLDVFKDSNYTFGTMMLILINAVLLASLAILPQMLQYMMGYDSFLSGLAIMPRGIGCLTATAIFGGLGGRISYKTYGIVGLTCLATGGWMLGLLNLQINPMNIAIPNFIFGMGLVFSFMPITTLSCITLKNDQMTNASGLQNLLKTIGGAVGTSLVATMISRFSQVHQNGLVKSMTELNPVFAERLQTYAGSFVSSAGDMATATQMAGKMLYNQLIQQSTLCAYMTTFKIFAIACACLIPFLLLLREKRK